MGSLMAGWSSSESRDKKSEKLRRNKSQIKDEIETYWKTNKRTEENPLDEALHAEDENQQSINGGSQSRMQRSLSLPLEDRLGGLRNIYRGRGAEKYSTDEDSNKISNCWWTRSNWAFLNEPPVKAMEGPAYKYAAQYHVADLGSVKTKCGSEMVAIEEGG